MDLLQRLAEALELLGAREQSVNARAVHRQLGCGRVEFLRAVEELVRQGVAARYGDERDLYLELRTDEPSEPEASGGGGDDCDVAEALSSPILGSWSDDYSDEDEPSADSYIEDAADELNILLQLQSNMAQPLQSARGGAPSSKAPLASQPDADAPPARQRTAAFVEDLGRPEIDNERVVKSVNVSVLPSFQPDSFAWPVPPNRYREFLECVETAVRNHGRLSFEDIHARWGPIPFDELEGLYREVEQRGEVIRDTAGNLVSADAWLEEQSENTRAVEQQASSGDAAIRGGDCPFKEGLHLHDWERSAIDRLVADFNHDQLRTLLGKKYAYAARLEGMQRNKISLAAALLSKHGLDLFVNKSVRCGVAEANGVKAPKNWHPGKRRAVQFVKEVGYPLELAGESGPERPDEIETWEAAPLRTLEPYQKDVAEKMLGVLRTGGRAIVTLPTGAGKTRVAVNALFDWMEGGGRSAVFWVAHTVELCEQACETFREVWNERRRVSTTLVRMFSNNADVAHFASALRRSKCVVSVWTPRRLLNKMKEGHVSLGRRAAALLIDEAHRAAAPTYRKVIEALYSLPNLPVVGLTATPFRQEYLDDEIAGTRDLTAIFGQLIEPATLERDHLIAQLQSRGVLSIPKFETISTGLNLHMPEARGELNGAAVENIDRELNERVDKPARRRVIVEQIRRYHNEAKENRILYFGPSVADAQAVAFLLRRSGIASAVVSAKTRAPTRLRAIHEFAAGRTRVLCNYEVLTTGFDQPAITHVVVARSTVSQVLYEQMIGRGLRGPLFRGTEQCVIVDCADTIRGEERPKLSFKRFRQIWRESGASYR